MGRLSAPTRITTEHRTKGFACAADSLTEWLTRRALKNEGNGGSRTYVVCDDNQVVGFYALAAGSIARKEAAGKLKRNAPDPIPAVILGRLAVDTRWQGQGVGGALLKDAVERALNVAEHVGARVLVVHALDEEASAFYKRHGFVESVLASKTLMLPLSR
jgi:GNAT superfamily N-acetyltransferase